jgi:acyl-CoA thioester hydrolase
MEPFEAAFQVQWADLDANNHLRNTGFLDYAAQTRMLFFESEDFPPSAFAEHAIGPVVLEDQVTYRRELRLLQPFRVQIACAGQSETGSKFVIENTIVRDDGKLCARVRSRGLWMALDTRKPVVPPERLRHAMDRMARTDDFVVLK